MDGEHSGCDLNATLDTRATCPPLHGTLPVMGVKSLSAISGTRRHFVAVRDGTSFVGLFVIEKFIRTLALVARSHKVIRPSVV